MNVVLAQVDLAEIAKPGEFVRQPDRDNSETSDSWILNEAIARKATANPLVLEKRVVYRAGDMTMTRRRFTNAFRSASQEQAKTYVLSPGTDELASYALTDADGN